MQTSVGARPAYQLTVSYTGQDGRAATVRDFGRGRVTVGLAYTPAAGEQDGSLYLVYGDDNNRATWYYQCLWRGIQTSPGFHRHGYPLGEGGH